ncbi:49d5e856-6af8-4c3d-888f-33f6dff254c4 [Thermothielavioides terrestris]|uniref:49d5e856-6af8-4c3d-888f-33f6dff254c4 n=1 Tax=Thermothielavioides terrestris TaxID=2587410 RepID=A0A3S4BNP5_9PEZI|nr:49d5e856-6af8-4c3d-888f-33f6dff254c4 [Thermothielavioides terrestris]
MADPLSMAASIAGVITLVDVVFSRLVKYAKSASNAASEAKAWADEVNAVGGLLNSLSRLARALEDEPFDATLRMHHIDGCFRVLSDLNQLLKKAEKELESPSQFTVLQRKLRWPLSTERIKELMSELSRHKESISMATLADSMNGILRCLALGSSLQASTSKILTEIRDTKRITARIQEDAERQRVLSFFLKANPQGRYETSLSLRHPRTGLWLLRLPAFQRWIDTAGSKLWLTGIPGAGKTVLAGSVIEAALARGSENVAIAFFFCDYKDESTQLPVNILGALAAQLALQKDEAYGVLARYYQELHGARHLSRNPTTSGLQKVLSNMLSLFDRAYLIVDALDECGNHVSDVVAAIASWAENEERLSIALFSRDETAIRVRLEDDYEKVEIAARADDVAEYVSAQIEERIRTGRLRIHDDRRDDAFPALNRFRWVACQLDHLGTCLTDRECRDALETLPPTLSETYSRILKRIPRRQVAVAQMALNFIAFAHPPLPIPLLEHAISPSAKGGSLGPGDIIRQTTISDLCSSLIRKSGSGHDLKSRFEFAHFSVREFLDSDELADLGLEHFRVSASSCARLLAVQCLRYLMLDNFNKVPEATIQSIGAVARENKRFYVFYDYASVFWAVYARGEMEDPEVADLATSFFAPQKTPAFNRWALCLSLQIQTAVPGTNTVECLLAAGARCDDSYLLPGSTISLMRTAIFAARDLTDFSVIGMLLAHGVTVSERELVLFERLLMRSLFLRDLSAKPTPLAQALPLFLLSLNDLAKSAPSALPLASLVWKTCS